MSLLLQTAPPGNAVEAAIRRLHALLVTARELGANAVAEWWVHTRPCSAPHGLHFDVDESRLRRGKGAYSLHHPVRPHRHSSSAVSYPHTRSVLEHIRILQTGSLF